MFPPSFLVIPSESKTLLVSRVLLIIRFSCAVRVILPAFPSKGVRLELCKVAPFVIFIYLALISILPASPPPKTGVFTRLKISVPSPSIVIISVAFILI